MNTSKSWLEKTEGSLQEINSVLQKMRELAVAGANGVLQTEDKQKIETEIAQMKEHLIQVGNDTYMGRHIFSGHQSDKPFLNKDGSYNENLGLLGLEYQYMDYKVGVSQDMTVNVTGDRVFGQSFKSAMIEGKPVEFADHSSRTTGFDINMDLTIKGLFDIVPPPLPTDPIQKIEKQIQIEDITLPTTLYDDGDLVSIVRDLNIALRNQIDDVTKTEVVQPTPPVIPPVPNLTPQEREQIKKQMNFVVDNDRIKLVTRDLDVKVDDFTETVQAGAEPLDPLDPPKGKLGFDVVSTPPADFVEAEQKLRPMIEVITELQNKLFSGDGEGVSALLKDIDDHITNILQIRGEVGSKVNTINIMNARMDDTTLNLKDLLSKTRDTDVAETLMHLTSSEAVYRASLAVSARIIQPTLIDFLR